MFCELIKQYSDKSDNTINIKFNPINTTLSITNENDNITIKLKNIFYKSFVKLGITDEWDMWIKMELPHTQNHHQIDFIEEQANKLWL